MAYDYYCTSCGKSLNQQSVLFDMQPLLTGSEDRRFNILSFCMTKAQLESLAGDGKSPEMGYKHCSLTLPQLMGIISDDHNLKEPLIAELSMQDILDYDTVPQANQETVKRPQRRKALFAEPDLEEEAAGGAAAGAGQETKAVSPAIQALEARDRKNADRVYTRSYLQSDLRILRNLFIEGSGETAVLKEFKFDILFRTERDNDNERVLCGYIVRRGEMVTAIDNARVCPYCGERIFDHAGTAEHRSITFFGDQAAGKTSTILALAHYAQSAMSADAAPDDRIWGGTPRIDSVASIELLNPDPRLREDMALYEEGIAPDKTQVALRSDAYSATFRIRNHRQRKHYLLTLTDLPGELCSQDTGKIDLNKVWETFPVALVSDAFVLCFDSVTAGEGRANRMIQMVCEWANEFQELRETYKKSVGEEAQAQRGRHGLYAPVMILFTKSGSLEQEEPGEEKQLQENRFDRITAAYMFNKERLEIEEDPVYKNVGSMINEFDHLKDAYHARLRCSPYGFAAPSLGDVNKGIKSNRDETGAIITPRPRHIDRLMRWILCVSGCIPTGAAYKPGLSDSVAAFCPPDNFITRAQYRALLPAGEGKDGDIREALARCYLFENPGVYDREFLRYFNQGMQLKLCRLRAKFDSNLGAGGK